MKKRIFKLAGRDCWYGRVTMAPYRYKRVKLSENERISLGWLSELQDAVNRRRAHETPCWDRIKAHGIPRPLLQSLGLVSKIAMARGKTWKAHVEDYAAELADAGRSAMYRYNAKRYLTLIGETAGWTALDDVDRDGFLGFLNVKRKEERGARTLRNIRDTFRMFLQWAVRTERAEAGVTKAADIDLPDPATDRKRIRRALTDAECAKLLAAVKGTPRELVYRVALATGLRRRELTALQWRDVQLDGTPRLCLRVDATKAKRADVIPLSPGIAKRLQAHKALRPFAKPTDSVLSGIPSDPTWKDDVERAGIAYQDAEGRIVGFHSLRVTLGTRLERMGVNVKARMELMRHRDPKLTYGAYVDSSQLETYRIVADLPAFDEPAEAAARSGTDDVPLTDVRDEKRDQKPLRGAARGCAKDHRPMPTSGKPAQHGNPCNSGVSAGKVRKVVASASNVSKAGRKYLTTGELGFEPRLSGPEPLVLPLHHSPSLPGIYRWAMLPMP